MQRWEKNKMGKYESEGEEERKKKKGMNEDYITINTIKKMCRVNNINSDTENLILRGNSNPIKKMFIRVTHIKSVRGTRRMKKRPREKGRR